MPQPPKAIKKIVRHSQHGEHREDPYDWLKDPNWQEVLRHPEVLAPEIRAHLEAENAYAAACLKPSDSLRQKLLEEMRARIKEEDSSVPDPDGPYAYFQRYVAGAQHPVFCRLHQASEAEEILLDGNRESEGQSFFRIGAALHSPDHRRLAYAVDLKGAEIFSLHIKDLGSGEIIDPAIESAHGQIAWSADGDWLFYTKLDDNHRPSSVYRHRLGSDPAADTLVYSEPHPGFFVSLDVTESRAFVVILAHDHRTSEVHLIPADQPQSTPRLVAPRETSIEYSLSHHGDRFLILTNADGAVDFKLAEAPLSEPGRENWRDLVPHKEGHFIRALRVFQDYFVRLERANGLPRLVVTGFERRSEP